MGREGKRGGSDGSESWLTSPGLREKVVGKGVGKG